MSLIRQTALRSFANFVLTTYNTNQASVQAPLPVKISDGFCSLIFISNVDGDGLLSYFDRGVHVLWLQSLPLTYACFVHILGYAWERIYEMGDYFKSDSDFSSCFTIPSALKYLPKSSTASESSYTEIKSWLDHPKYS